MIIDLDINLHFLSFLHLRKTQLKLLGLAFLFPPFFIFCLIEFKISQNVFGLTGA